MAGELKPQADTHQPGPTRAARLRARIKGLVIISQTQKKTRKGDGAYEKTLKKLKRTDFDQWIETFLAEGNCRPSRIK
jgi:stalled ribosome alternative rescue factor ArfA